jgi:TonB family protein
MSCNDVASVLDDHRIAQLKPAERAKIDAHLGSCADCSAAWQATSELLELRIPAMPPTLLERALLASRLPQSARSRRARMPIIVGGALLAGAAAAAVTMSALREQSVPIASSPSVEQPAAPAAPEAPVDEPVTPVENTPAAPQGDGVTSVELVETALSIAPLVRRPPDYPPEALAQRLEGWVQLKFDVTAAGFVENVSVDESSDERFEGPAIRALSQWRYLPRIVAGKRVAVTDQRTRIAWQMSSDDDPPADERQADDKQEAAMRGLLKFSDDLERALDLLAADDLRGAELQLDLMRAVYPEAGFFHGDIWSFYGYLFTVQGNYDRAIDAYETGLASYERNGARSNMGPWVPLANLYFARHQYDAALKTLLRPNLPGGNRLMSPEANALMQKLNALGVTEDTL